jgi:hypothetical protein
MELSAPTQSFGLPPTVFIFCPQIVCGERQNTADRHGNVVGVSPKRTLKD